MATAKEKEGEAPEKDPKKTGKEAPPGEEGEEGAEGQPPAKKSNKKIIIIGAAALVLLLVAAGGAYFAFSKKPEETGRAEVELGADGKPVDKPVYYTLPEFLINLNAGGKQTSFLKTTVILELTKQGDVALVEANMPRLLDGFNTYLRELRASDLSGSAGIQRLREELLLRANKALSPVKISDVLFKEIVIQ